MDSDTSTVVAGLCDGYWEFPGPLGCRLQFKQDGTGEIRCGIELNTFIAAEMEWKLLQSTLSLPDPAQEPGKIFDAKLSIEMTITPRRLPEPGALPGPNMFLLTTAYRPKPFTLELSKGRFPVKDLLPDDQLVYYGRRLKWDPSPYPPLEEWDERHSAGPRAGRYWDKTEFFADLDFDPRN